MSRLTVAALLLTGQREAFAPMPGWEISTDLADAVARLLTAVDEMSRTRGQGRTAARLAASRGVDVMHAADEVADALGVPS